MIFFSVCFIIQVAMFNPEEMSDHLYDENNTITCNRCKLAKKSTEFYNSCLARKSFYCKGCHNTITTSSRKTTLDDASKLLQILRRNCKKDNLRVNFNINQTRRLLNLWKEHDPSTSNDYIIVVWQKMPDQLDVQLSDVAVVPKSLYKKIRSIPIRERRFALPSETICLSKTICDTVAAN